LGEGGRDVSDADKQCQERRHQWASISSRDIFDPFSGREIGGPLRGHPHQAHSIPYPSENCPCGTKLEIVGLTCKTLVARNLFQFDLDESRKKGA
jgi:hypothetical protein